MSNVIFQAAISVLAESVVINPRPKECTCTFIGIHVSHVLHGTQSIIKKINETTPSSHISHSKQAEMK